MFAEYVSKMDYKDVRFRHIYIILLMTDMAMNESMNESLMTPLHNNDIVYRVYLNET